MEKRESEECEESEEREERRVFEWKEIKRWIIRKTGK